MNNKLSRWQQLKNYCADKLWFAALLTPLLIIAIIINQHDQATGRSGVNKGMPIVAGTVEISTTELAAIVAKPLAELIAMDVYPAINPSAVIATANSEEKLGYHPSKQLSEIRRVKHNLITVISYVPPVATKTKRIGEAS